MTVKVLCFDIGSALVAASPQHQEICAQFDLFQAAKHAGEMLAASGEIPTPSDDAACRNQTLGMLYAAALLAAQTRCMSPPDLLQAALLAVHATTLLSPLEPNPECPACAGNGYLPDKPCDCLRSLPAKQPDKESLQ